MSTLLEVSKQLEGRVVAEKLPLLRRIGGSEHSAVFLTETVVSSEKKNAAIKLISADGLFRNRSEQELQLSRWAEAASLSHPNLIQIFASGRCEIDGAPFLYVVMEYAEENLAQVVPQRPLTPEEVADLLPPTADALAFLHQAGFSHGHTKPANVMAVANQLKISTDGLGKSGERMKEVSTAYDAPEISQTGMSPAADIWSLGIMLVEVLTQRRPDANNIVNGQIAIPDSLPAPFHEISQRCLRVDPRERCTASDVVRKLRGQADFRPLPVDRPAPAEPPIVIRSKKSWVGPVIIATALVLAIFLGRWFMNRGPAAPVPASQSSEQSTPASVSPAPSPTVPQETKPIPQENTQGQVLGKVLPEISRSAQNTIHGRVKVSVHVSVDGSGNVSQVSLASPGPSKYFAREALAAAKNWKFSAPLLNGQPSSSEWLLRFEFGSKSIQVFPSQIKP